MTACCLLADFPQHSQHSIKFRREFRQNSAGAAATPARGWRGPGRRPRRQQCPPRRRRRRAARHPAAARRLAPRPRQTASIIHVSPSSVYVIFLPNSAGDQNTAGARPPPAAKMRTKKAGSSGTAARHGRRGLRHPHSTFNSCPCYILNEITTKRIFEL